MPRISRLKVKGETAVYHVMSRTALSGFVIKDVDKDYLLEIIKKFSSLYFVDVIKKKGDRSIVWHKFCIL